MSKILIVDDDVAGGRTLQLHLASQDHQVEVATDVEEGLAKSEEFVPELIILDIRMPGRSGLEGLPEFKAIVPQARVIMITAFHDMESTIQAMQQGAEEYIHKPIDIDELDAAIDKLLERNNPDDQQIEADYTRVGQITMVGHSHAMKEVFKTIGMVARNSATVLITGESGTGKELVARAIHYNGEHPEGPFVAINCAAVVESLLESEMFGHEKGAFSGAISKQPGKFTLANNGTIFLDEISEMSRSVQAKLLRAIQYKEYTPVGGAQSLKTSARLVAATNEKLLQSVAEGRFREDLYYRLQVVNIHLPPLRERREDIEELVRSLLARVNVELDKKVSRINREALQCLQEYHWPGNVRELENLLMKAVALCPGDTLTRDLLPAEVCRAGNTQTIEQTLTESNGEQKLLTLDQVTSNYVSKVLDEVNWHRGQACDILGISRPRLRRIIREYNLQPPQGTLLE